MLPAKIEDVKVQLSGLACITVTDERTNAAAVENTKLLSALEKEMKLFEEPIKKELYAPYKAHLDKYGPIYDMIKAMKDAQKKQIAIYANSLMTETIDTVKTRTEFSGSSVKKHLTGTVTDTIQFLDFLFDGKAEWLNRVVSFDQAALNDFAELFPNGAPGLRVDTVSKVRVY